MLARVAESLYWIGRNIERCEHSSRYMKVQFYSTLNAPMSQNVDFAMRSVLFISGGTFQNQGILNENVIWQNVIFSPDNENSLISLVKNVRENARSIRNSIPEEFWESINKWYLHCKKLNAQQFSSDGIFELIEDMDVNIVLIKSRLHHTFLHDNIWHFINLGIYIESAMQVLRIIRTKISDSIILSNNGENQALLQYQWTTLLMSLEAFGIHKKAYQGLRSKSTIFELLLANADFTRSVKYTTSKIKRHLSGISVHPEGHQEVKTKFDEILAECLTFSDFSDEEKIIELIDKAYNCISNFHFDIEKLYFQ